MNLINAVLISEWHNVLRVTVTGLSYPAISPTNLKCHLDKSFKLILEYRSFQISPQLPNTSRYSQQPTCAPYIMPYVEIEAWNRCV